MIEINPVYQSIMPLFFEPDPKEKEKAIQYLLEIIPNEIWNDIKKSQDESGDEWYIRHSAGK